MTVDRERDLGQELNDGDRAVAPPTEAERDVAESLDARLDALAESVRGTYQTIEEMTCAFLREAIRQGIFRPGQHLQQDNIAAFLGVSRMPVRAALRQLESEGLVSFHAHRGGTVKSLRPSQIAELYDLRILLETYAIERAMERLTPVILDDLAKLGEEVETSTGTNGWLDRRHLFYERLYSLADRPETVRLITLLRSQVGRYLLLRPVADQSPGHLPLVSYLRDNDVEGAKQWIREHLSQVSLELQRLVEEEELSPPSAVRP